MGRQLANVFLESAARHPEKKALWIGTREWTYAQVEEKARIWARALVEGQTAPVGRIGIFAARSEVSYVGVLAALFAGATFVPLNPSFPVARTRAMIEQADLDAIMVEEACFGQLTEALAGLPNAPRVLVPASDAKTAGPAAAPLEVLPAIDPQRPAYLLFTSGSTGKPKGVPVTHANVLHFLDVNQRRYRITPEDRLTQTFEQTFDLSIFDLFMAWGAGACLCALSPLELLAPFRVVREKGITVWFSVPSIVALLRNAKRQLLTPNSLPTLRLSLFCGEALPRKAAEAWQAAAPSSVLENLYGPTELTIACAAYRWDSERSPRECVGEVVPVGEIYEGLSHCIVDEAQNDVPDGGDGELCVAGPQTFPGYFRDDAATASRFFTRPSDSTGGELRFYRTGDRVRRAGDSLVYLGRVDHQVKVGGYRIELGEIESVLGRGAGVSEAAAVAWPMVDGVAKGIVAFVTGVGIDVDALRSELRSALPSYMVPSKIQAIDAMPLNANGKIDRLALRRTCESEEKTRWPVCPSLSAAP